MVVIHVLYDGSVSNVWKKEDKKNSLTNLVRTGRQYAGGWWYFGMGEQHRSQDELEGSSSDSAEMALKYRTTGDFSVDLIVRVSAFRRLCRFVGGLPPLFSFGSRSTLSEQFRFGVIWRHSSFFSEIRVGLCSGGPQR